MTLNLQNKVIAAYLFTMPFTAILAINKTLPLPLFFLVLVTSISLLTANIKIIKFKRTDFLFLIIILLGLIPWVTTSNNLGSKNYNHAAAISVSLFIYYIMVRSFFLNQKNFSWEKFSSIARLSLLFLSTAIILEFVLASFYGLFLSDILPSPYSEEELGRPNLFINYMRPRAFTSEAGYTALFFEVLLPVSWLLDNKRIRHLFSWFLIILAYLLLASAASIFSLSVSIFLTFIMLKDKNKIFYFIIILILLTISYFSIDGFQYFIDDVLFRKIQVLNMSEYDLERRVRPYIYYTSYTIIADNPFGIGWGSLSQSFSDNIPINDKIPFLIGGGAISLFLEIALASGWIGLMLFIFIIINNIIQLYQVYYKYNNYIPALAVAISLTSISFHHMFISLYHLPFIWFALAFADYTIYYCKNNQISSHCCNRKTKC